MINFKKEIEFERLYIDTSYIYDASIEVEKTQIKDLKGNVYKLNNIIATKRNNNSEVEILFNTTEDGYSYFQMEIDQFKNADILKAEIMDYLNKNIDIIKY